MDPPRPSKGLLESLVEKLHRTKDDLSGKLSKQKDEIQREAAERAAEVVIERGARAAKAAAAGLGKRLEIALFGDAEGESEKPPAPPEEDSAADRERKLALARERVASARATKLDEARRHEDARRRDEARRDQEVDAELAALKRKIEKER